MSRRPAYCWSYGTEGRALEIIWPGFVCPVYYHGELLGRQLVSRA